MTNNLIFEPINNLDSASKEQISVGLQLQNYCNSVLQQSAVDFSGFKNLEKYQTEINDGLILAQSHADNYLTVIQPSIITNLTSLDNFYSLYSAVPMACPPGSTKNEWIDVLYYLKDQAITYQSASSGIVSSLTKLSSELNVDAAAFSKIVSNLNAAVNGDQGVLADIEKQLSDIDSKIGGAIAGIVLSGLAIVGGVFMIAVGSIASFITAGASLTLAAGGVAVLAAGIGGEVASALVLKGLNDTKGNLLTQRSSLTAEVNMALGASGAYTNLSDQVKGAVTASTSMSNAWSVLTGDMDNIASNIDKGIISTDAARSLFLAGANGAVKTAIEDIKTIKLQMSGVQTLSAPNNENIGDFAVEIAKGQTRAQLDPAYQQFLYNPVSIAQRRRAVLMTV